ncbi:unnamed protein product, partial [Ectocarpus sp. 4 AP-2014]
EGVRAWQPTNRSTEISTTLTWVKRRRRRVAVNAANNISTSRGNTCQTESAITTTSTRPTNQGGGNNIGVRRGGGLRHRLRKGTVQLPPAQSRYDSSHQEMDCKKETERQRAASKRLRSASSEEGRVGRESCKHHHRTPATTSRSVIHSSSPGPSSVAPHRRGSAVSSLCPRVSPPPQPSSSFSSVMPLCAPRRALAGGRAVALGHAAAAVAAATVVAVPEGIHSSDRWTALEVSIPRVEVESPTANVVNDSSGGRSSSSTAAAAAAASLASPARTG